MSDPSEETLPAEAQGDGAMQRPTADPLTTISVDQLTNRVEKVRLARAEVMEEDVHYGIIPGTGDKPTLLKPGAEILCSLFQLAPDPELEVSQLEGDHREYIVRGGLRHIPSGNRVGSGYGSCSTKESKYRYRYIEESTDVPVPNAFWRSADEMKDRDFSILLDALKNEGIHIPSDAEPGVTKEQGTWLITLEGKGENPDLADVYNTCLKMAKKRWLVDVTLTATAASEIFTQDLDDLEDLRGTDVGTASSPSQATSSQQSTQNQSGQSSPRVDRHGYQVLEKHAKGIDRRDKALEEKSGTSLADAIEAVEVEIQDWPDRPRQAAEAMLDTHRDRLEKQIDEETKPDENEDKAGQDGGSDLDYGLPQSYPTGFPKASRLQQFGLASPRELKQFLDEGGDLQSIDQVGETSAEEIEAALQELQEEWEEPDFEPDDEIPF